MPEQNHPFVIEEIYHKTQDDLVKKYSKNSPYEAIIKENETHIALITFGYDSTPESPLAYHDANLFLEFQSVEEQLDTIKEYEEKGMIENQDFFLVSKYKHSLVRYFIPEKSGQYCRFDTNFDKAILTIPDDVPSDQKRAYADSVLEQYSNWCNGNVYGYQIHLIDKKTRHFKKNVASCWGFYDFEDVQTQAIAEAETILLPTPITTQNKKGLNYEPSN